MWQLSYSWIKFYLRWIIKADSYFVKSTKRSIYFVFIYLLICQDIFQELISSHTCDLSKCNDNVENDRLYNLIYCMLLFFNTKTCRIKNIIIFASAKSVQLILTYKLFVSNRTIKIFNEFSEFSQIIELFVNYCEIFL